MAENKQALNENELEQVAGGASNDYIHDLSNFIPKTVCNVVKYDDPSSCLTMRYSPNGEVIYGVGWQNGDTIMIHRDYTEGGWLFAWKNGTYGYVNPNYVC
ncbi:MAG: hypothetical protein Q4C09_04850 [Atopobiaceae bacterium]|nr:hypothetical protein [Atopobiaceae bacterium]